MPPCGGGESGVVVEAEIRDGVADVINEAAVKIELLSADGVISECLSECEQGGAGGVVHAWWLRTPESWPHYWLTLDQ